MSKKPRSVIITGDDFGSSSSVNQAIIEAHRRGVLTSASLMVTGDAFEEAIRLARQHPRLAVGLHLVLIDGKAALPPSEVPRLVDSDGMFLRDPLAAGSRYFCAGLRPAVRRELLLEIRAQLEKFRRTGLRLSHVDGHQHMHTLPVVLDALIQLAGEFGIRAVRIPSEELGLALRVDRADLLAKLTHYGFFRMRRRSAARRLSGAGIQFPERVYGLLQSGKVTEDYLLKLIPHIQADLVEIYSHPTVDAVATARGASRPQLEALTSGRVRDLLEAEGFQLATYQELS